MNVLLLSMPDTSEHTPAVAIRMPNGALTSLAGNVDSHHRVAVADLVVASPPLRATLERLVGSLRPDVIGLSVMTFQRGTARRVIAFLQSICPGVTVVVGGYDPSLAPDAWMDSRLGVDFIVRGEGEATFRDLLRALESGTGVAGIAGLCYRAGDRFVSNPPRPVARIAEGGIALPNRSARVLDGYTMLGRQVDVVETSRGCTFDCSFCSIIEMRGRNFHRYPLDRVLADIADARARGARTIFFVDDNITLDMPRFAALCRGIVAAGFDDVDYIVQGMTAAIAAHGETIAPLMRQAGFRYVFLGIENVLDEGLSFLKASAKNAERRQGRRVGNAARTAIDVLHRHGMFVVGGLIVGNPDDTPDAVLANLAFARKYVDWPYIQHPTPYPGTPMTAEFIARGLVVNEDVDQYDGTTAVTRSGSMDAAEIEFMRWRDERWMKVRHMPAAFAHDPWFVVRNGRRMMAHTFRGSTWRSAIGLESPRQVFERFRQIRRKEREYLAWPDPLAAGQSVVHAHAEAQAVG